MTPERERVRKPISGWNLKQAGWVEKEAGIPAQISGKHCGVQYKNSIKNLFRVRKQSSDAPILGSPCPKVFHIVHSNF